MIMHTLAALAAVSLILAGCGHTDSDLKKERDRARGQLSTAEESLASANARIAALQAELEEAKADASPNATARIAELTMALDQANSTANRLQGELDAANASLAEAEAARDRAQAALNAALADGTSDTAELSRLRSELATATSALTAARAALATANADKVNLQATIDELRGQVGDLQDQLAMMDSDPDPEMTLETTLETTGSFSTASSSITQIVNGVRSQVIEQSIQIGNWGYWGKKGDDTLFRAHLSASGTLTNGVPRQSFSSSVTGSRAGSSPVAGSAVWTGGVRGVTATFTRVTGESRIEADLGAATLDVAFTAFDNGQADMTWDGLSMANGAFRDGTRLEGAFYGAEHEGIAGKFNRDGLRGVFGALRE